MHHCERQIRPDEEAWDLVCEWVQSDSLRKHLLGVEAAMLAYARKLGGDEERWAVTGLVHDLDYERHPDLDDADNGHPRTALRLFEELGWPQDVIDAVAGHATFLGVAARDRHGEGALRGRRALRASSPPARSSARPGSRG